MAQAVEIPTVYKCVFLVTAVLSPSLFHVPHPPVLGKSIQVFQHCEISTYRPSLVLYMQSVEQQGTGIMFQYYRQQQIQTVYQDHMVQMDLRYLHQRVDVTGAGALHFPPVNLR